MRHAFVGLVVAAGGCGRVAFDEVVAPLDDAAGADAMTDAITNSPFGDPVRITSLDDAMMDSTNPTLSDDELEIFIIRRGSSPGDVYTATRSSTSMPWGTAVSVGTVNDAADDSGLHLSRDRLTLWLASARAGGSGMHDIYFATRPAPGMAFAAPVRVTELSSAMSETSPAVDGAARFIVFNRSAIPRDLFASQRSSATAMWSAPVLLAEASGPADDVAAELSPDGLALYFVSDRQGPANNMDLWFATRPTLADPFGPPMPIAELNTLGAESTPWISPDGRVLYFASDRDGPLSIYRAER